MELNEDEDVQERCMYLLHAAHLLEKVQGARGCSRGYLGDMRDIAVRAGLELGLKERICVRCGVIWVAGRSAKVRLSKQRRKRIAKRCRNEVRISCNVCGYRVALPGTSKRNKEQEKKDEKQNSIEKAAKRAQLRRQARHSHVDPLKLAPKKSNLFYSFQCRDANASGVDKVDLRKKSESSRSEEVEPTRNSEQKQEEKEPEKSASLYDLFNSFG